MAAFDANLWQRLSPILDVALELPTEQRAGFVARACEGDAEGSEDTALTSLSDNREPSFRP